MDTKKSLALFGATTGTVITVSPVMAQTATDPIQQTTTMVNSLGTLAGVVTTVVLGAMVVRLGIKFVNRMTVKG